MERDLVGHIVGWLDDDLNAIAQRELGGAELAFLLFYHLAWCGQGLYESLCHFLVLEGFDILGLGSIVGGKELFLGRHYDAFLLGHAQQEHHVVGVVNELLEGHVDGFERQGGQ